MSAENSSFDAFADLYQLRPITVFCMAFSAISVPIVIAMLYSGTYESCFSLMQIYSFY